MKIVLAQTAGFCMGVRRAVDLAIDNAPRLPQGVYTLGPLIHNSQTIHMLRERGVEEMKESAPPPPTATIIIRAHGVAPETQKKLTDRGHPILDGTCPKVKTVHRVITKFRNDGYSIIIAGDKGHAEVIGLLGYAGEKGILIQHPHDATRLPDFPKVCLVSQTTFDKETFEAIAIAVKNRYPHAEVVIKKTICSATERRQEEIRHLASQVDAVIVVGGKNSANTQRLATIAAESGKPVQLIETETELNWSQIAQCRSVGISAGASTPNWMIQRLVDHLQFLSKQKTGSTTAFFWKCFDIAADLNVLVAIGAVLVYGMSCNLQGCNLPGPHNLVIVFLYFLSMYLWNSLANIEVTRHLGIGRYKFYHDHKHLVLWITGSAFASLLIISFLQGSLAFWLMLAATVTGSLYHVSIVPRPLQKLIHYANLKDIPTSRDLFVALAWAIILTFLPQTTTGTFNLSIPAMATFLWIFFLSYIRSLLFDMRDIEGDRIMGRETLITIIGEKRAEKLMLILIQILTVAAALFSVSMLAFHIVPGTTTLASLFQIPVLLYIFFFMKKLKSKKFRHTSLFNLLADLPFYLAGGLSLLSLLFF